MERIKKLTVKYDGKIVGYLEDVYEDAISFVYDEKWIRTGFSLAPNGLSLAPGTRYYSKKVFHGLFNESLPGAWGNMIICRLLEKKGVAYYRLSPLEKLMYVGNNALGAQTFEPTHAQKTYIPSADLDLIERDVYKLSDDSTGVDWDRLFTHCGSCGGERPKAFVKIDGEEWVIYLRRKIDPADIGKRQFDATSAAKACGINTGEFRLFQTKSFGSLFGAKRFDRKGTKRLHTVSVASMMEFKVDPDKVDYLHLFQLIYGNCADKSDMYEMFRRMAFNVLYGNNNDSSANVSFVYDESRGGYRLAPAYAVIKKPAPGKKMLVCQSKNPTKADMLRIASIMDLSETECNKIIQNTELKIRNLI